ncbi:hypothetical protein HDU92_001385, partial [Lobulomyces angularis]
IGAAAKSAQVGLSAWLASAMEGPTPVSALIHAATIRYINALNYVLINRLDRVHSWNGVLIEYDLKRVIAYSTTSQLGYMVIACGLSQYNLSLFHLVNHAFFKALLFLSAGAVIHAIADEQDLRKMGVTQAPKNYTRYIAYIFAIMAAVLSAIYSKDNIKDPDYLMTIPLFLLTLGAVFFGFFAQISFIVWGSTIFMNAIFIHPNNVAIFDGSILYSIETF